MQRETALQLIEKAQALGATLAGIVRVADFKGVLAARGIALNADWLQEGQSVMVLALEHSIREPELDWWGTESGTQGNHRLKMVCEELRLTLAKEFKIKSKAIKYQADNMGIYLKDAAVMAGLGTIGANNLLLTPQYGPRIRLRGLLLDEDIPTTQSQSFSPCDSCDKRCWKACPQNAFRTGVYDRLSCRVQMRKDEMNRTAVETAQWGWITYVKYCRVCELTCPLGDIKA